MEKLTEDQIKALFLTEKEQKSNEAFATLVKVIKHYNNGWYPTVKNRGYMIYSKKMISLWGGRDNDWTDSQICSLISEKAPSPSFTGVGSLLSIRDYNLSQFIAKNYEQEYKDLWMEDEQ